MQIIPQIEFNKPAPPPLEDDPLVVHRFRKGQDRAIVIFVHGYGENRFTTWGQFPIIYFRSSQ
jgi:hypothetical protein